MDLQPLVSILDDDATVGGALARLLKAAGFHARTWTSATEFLDSPDIRAPGCLVVDQVMPDMTGLQLQLELVRRGCVLPVIFVTAHGDVATTVAAMKAGAVTFLTKPVRRDDLLPAVTEAISREGAERRALEQRQFFTALMGTLTPREQQVLELVALGLLNKQIAARLGTVEKTIKVHRGRLMQKLKVRSAAELVRKLVAYQLLDSARGAVPLSLTDERG